MQVFVIYIQSYNIYNISKYDDIMGVNVNNTNCIGLTYLYMFLVTSVTIYFTLLYFTVTLYIYIVSYIYIGSPTFALSMLLAYQSLRVLI